VEYYFKRIENVEDKILTIVFNSLPVVVIGVFGALGSLLLSKRHLSVRVVLGVVSVTAVLILSTDVLAIEKGLSENMRVFFAAAGGVFIKELSERVRDKYKKIIGDKK